MNPGEPMDDATRHAVLQLLGNAMSDVSEDCYCAGWGGGTEYFVPELCHRAIESGQPQYWGQGEITVETARSLTYLAEQLGCWANLDDAGVNYVPHSPFPIPKQYIEAIEREQLYQASQDLRTKSY
jgi:hypothetical protein